MKKCFLRPGQYLASLRVVNAATVRCYKHSAAGPDRSKLVTLMGGLCVQHLSKARVTVLYYGHLLPLDAMQIGSYNGILTGTYNTHAVLKGSISNYLSDLERLSKIFTE